MNAAEDALREALLAVARRMNPLGINHGKAGNVSVRCERDGVPGLLVTPSGLPYERTRPRDLCWMPLDATDETQSDGAFLPSSEWRMHRDLLRARPEAGAVVHTHSQAATTLACLPRVQADGIPAFHYMVAAAGGTDIRCAPYATFGSQALSDHAVAALDGRLACLLAHHGALALGTGEAEAALERALALAVEVESLSDLYARLLALTSAPPVLDAAEMARVLEAFRHYGRPREAG